MAGTSPRAINNQNDQYPFIQYILKVTNNYNNIFPTNFFDKDLKQFNRTLYLELN